MVEDLHLEPKLDSKSKSNRKSRAARIQDKVNFCGALSSRGVQDPARVDRDSFVAEYKYASKNYLGARHNASKHLLSKSWSKILGKKTWETVSEETLRRNSAAFRWLQKLANADSGSDDVPEAVDVARYSKLCPPFVLLRKLGEACHWVLTTVLLTTTTHCCYSFLN